MPIQLSKNVGALIIRIGFCSYGILFPPKPILVAKAPIVAGEATSLPCLLVKN